MRERIWLEAIQDHWVPKDYWIKADRSCGAWNSEMLMKCSHVKAKVTHIKTWRLEWGERSMLPLLPVARLSLLPCLRLLNISYFEELNHQEEGGRNDGETATEINRLSPACKCISCWFGEPVQLHFGIKKGSLRSEKGRGDMDKMEERKWLTLL